MADRNEERQHITGAEVDANVPRQTSPISAGDRRVLFGILFGGPAILAVIVWLAR